MLARMVREKYCECGDSIFKEELTSTKSRSCKPELVCVKYGEVK